MRDRAVYYDDRIPKMGGQILFLVRVILIFPETFANLSDDMGAVQCKKGLEIDL